MYEPEMPPCAFEREVSRAKWPCSGSASEVGVTISTSAAAAATAAPVPGNNFRACRPLLEWR